MFVKINDNNFTALFLCSLNSTEGTGECLAPMEDGRTSSQQLVPTGEVLHVAIAIILANVVVKLSPVQKSGKLSKNVFVLEHSSQLIWLQSYKIKSVSFQKTA